MPIAISRCHARPQGRVSGTVPRRCAPPPSSDWRPRRVFDALAAGAVLGPGDVLIAIETAKAMTEVMTCDAGGSTVELDIFFGMPNPTWVLTDAEADAS